MNTDSFFRQIVQTHSPEHTTIEPKDERSNCQSKPTQLVSGFRLSFADDAEREQFIKDCAHEMEIEWAAWEKHGCFAARGSADRWRMDMEEAIRGRSDAQKARMTREIDERMAREPGGA